MKKHALSPCKTLSDGIPDFCLDDVDRLDRRIAVSKRDST
jgi:hypothetical protein